MNTSVSPQLSLPPSDQGGWRWERILALMVAVFAIAGIALFILNSTQSPSPGVDTSAIKALTPPEIAQILMRSGDGPNDVPLDILYAPTWYFDWNNRALPEIESPVLGSYARSKLVDEKSLVG